MLHQLELQGDRRIADSEIRAVDLDDGGYSDVRPNQTVDSVEFVPIAEIPRHFTVQSRILYGVLLDTN